MVFFDFTSTESFEVASTPITVYRNAAHSWWHDDPTDPACREKFARRIARLKAIQAHDTPVLFVRVVATTDELPEADTLLHVLAQEFGPQAKLLLIVPAQRDPALGPHLIDDKENLLVYLAPMANYAEAISAGLSWISGQLLNCKRSRSLTSIEGLLPAHTGFFGMGGVPAFENIPDHVPRPQLSAVNVRSNPQIAVAALRQSYGNVRVPAPKDSYPNVVSYSMWSEKNFEPYGQDEDDDEDPIEWDDGDEDKRKGLKSFCGEAAFAPIKSIRTSADAGGFLSMLISVFPGCVTEAYPDEGSEDDEEIVITWSQSR
jgi:hypothetical protein